MKHKNLAFENSSNRWDINEIAFLEFCRRKELKHADISKLLERSYSSVTQMASKIGQWQKGKSNPKSYITPLIEKAMRLELEVRGGIYPDMRSAWYSKISKVTGITYDFPDTPSQLEKSPEELVVETRTEGEDEPKEDDTFVSIKIELGFARAKELLRLIFGK